eukprot:540180-Prymnesium_polylepis.1
MRFICARSASFAAHIANVLFAACSRAVYQNTPVAVNVGKCGAHSTPLQVRSAVDAMLRPRYGGAGVIAEVRNFATAAPL